jgi:hypothetical protein
MIETGLISAGSVPRIRTFHVGDEAIGSSPWHLPQHKQQTRASLVPTVAPTPSLELELELEENCLLSIFHCSLAGWDYYGRSPC